MHSKLILFIVFQIVKLATSKSFTIVLDTTVSMQEEIEVLRRNLPYITNILKNESYFEDFILLPFKDTDVAQPIISSSPDHLLSSISGLTTSGGHDCPEDSLSGIQKALEVSRPESFVYVFTDAFAKDTSKFQAIEDLCRNTRSQVVIFLSGSCYGAEYGQQGSIDVYYDIAKSCSGLLFKFDVITLRKGFKYIEEIITTDWNDVISHEPFVGYKQFTLSMDSFTRDVLVAVSGDYPSLQIVEVAGNYSPDLEKIVDARQALVVRVSNFRSGLYQVSVRCRGPTSLALYRNRIQFEYGFSTRVPRSLKETSLRPIPGWLNYILIVLPPAYNIQITSLELQMADREERRPLSLNQSEREGFYVASVFMESDRSFRCVIHGKDSVTFEEFTGSSRLVEVQKTVKDPVWMKPVIEILQEYEDNLADYGKNYTLACKVKGYPKPEIQWQDEQESAGLVLATEEILLEMPSTFINYVTMNATANSTICCRAINANGEDYKCLEYYVNRTFSLDVIESPKDETFEFGTEGKLICKVDAFPDPEYKWYHNDSSIESLDNFQIIPEEYALVIKNMTLDDVGTYKCEATNALKAESLIAEVTISGLDAPEIEVVSPEFTLSPGDYKSIECRVVKGNPAPVIIWKYNSFDENEFHDEVPSEVYVEDGILKIPAAKIEHKGVYRCIASNMMGEDYRDVSVKIQYAPKIANSDDGTVTVMEGDIVELACDVDAIPDATVRWEMTQDDVIVTLDQRHTTNNRNTHRFYALWKDSGNYRCFAENDIGNAEKTVSVNVEVAPFIEPPVSRVVEVSPGSSISLPCNVLYGNPVPTTKWEFISYDSTTSVLARGNTSKTQLHLYNVSRANEGMYLCIADNKVGNDRIRIYLRLK